MTLQKLVRPLTGYSPFQWDRFPGAKIFRSHIGTLYKWVKFSHHDNRTMLRQHCIPGRNQGKNRCSRQRNEDVPYAQKGHLWQQCCRPLPQHLVQFGLCNSSSPSICNSNATFAVNIKKRRDVYSLFINEKNFTFTLLHLNLNNWLANFDSEIRNIGRGFVYCLTR